MIYFDNAATTYKKPLCVYKALHSSLKSLSANPGRSSHKAAILASEAVYNSRVSVADLFNCEPDQVVFTYNATYALNMAIKTLIKEKCHIIISDLEHNSVFRVIKGLEKELGVEYSIFNSDALTENELKRHLRNDTRAIVSTLASNVTGKVIDEKILSDFAKKNRLSLILDASQAAGHRAINLRELEYYAICAPGHKGLFGIMGCGFSIFGNKCINKSFMEGGSGSDSLSPFMPDYLPDRLEAGTLGLPGIVALSKGTEFVKKMGEEEIEEKLSCLTKTAIDRFNEIKGIKVYGGDSGIISFSLSNIASSAAADQLDRYGIAVRGGLHCSPLAHKKLGTLECGLVRISFSIFNKKSEIDKLYYSLKNITNANF